MPPQGGTTNGLRWLALSDGDGYTAGMSIYTRTGDRGETDLFGGPRVPKDAARLEACGDLDELDSLLGLARCESLPRDDAALLAQIQQRLVPIRAELIGASSTMGVEPVGAADLEGLEREIDRRDDRLEPLTTFIVPGGCRASAALHVARSVCRRAERRLVTLARSEPSAVSPPLLAYVNRLSDLLFVLARSANARAGLDDL